MRNILVLISSMVGLALLLSCQTPYTRDFLGQDITIHDVDWKNIPPGTCIEDGFDILCRSDIEYITIIEIEKVEVPVEVIVEVPVEKIVERVIEKIVIQEVPVEKIVEKVIQELVIEYVTEYVTVPVLQYVPVYVEVPTKIIEKIVEYVEVPVIEYVYVPEYVQVPIVDYGDTYFITVYVNNIETENIETGNPSDFLDDIIIPEGNYTTFVWKSDDDDDGIYRSTFVLSEAIIVNEIDKTIIHFLMWDRDNPAHWSEPQAYLDIETGLKAKDIDRAEGILTEYVNGLGL